MSTLEQEIIDRFRQLESPARQRVLDILEQLERERPLSALELMQLPDAERKRRVQAAITSAVDEDFETFEAYGEEVFHD
ncbi:MAG: hypothetical protein H6671_05685 [Anaerolineaceae bacterium]|nr:hypothetical protein [Anaerolineaceae bacterium]